MEAEASKRDPILELAWQTYASLDLSANRRVKGFYDLRKWIAQLGILATLFAILTQQFFSTSNSSSNSPMLGNLTELVVRGLFILVSILAAVLAAYVPRSYSAGSWLIYRAAAEEVKEAIYFYRSILPKDRSRREYLKKRLSEIQRAVMSKLGGEYALEDYKGPLPSNYRLDDPNSDPGFHDLTGDEYVKYRLKDQLDWHRRKIGQRKSWRSLMNIAILAAGIGGALLSIRGGPLAIWVVLMIAIMSALLGWQELRKVDETIKNYSDIVLQLGDLYNHWEDLTPEERTLEEFRNVVLGCERVFRTPDRQYVRSLREADLEKEAALINQVIVESADSAQRAREQVHENIFETTERFSPKAEQSVEEEFKPALETPGKEGWSDVVQNERPAVEALTPPNLRGLGESPPSKLEEVSFPSISPTEGMKTMLPPKGTRSGKAKRNGLFISYSHQDRDWLAKVQRHMKALENMGIAVNLWDDTQIQAGMKWREEIEKALASAKVAVLLVSTDFLNSDFISRDEIPALLKAAQEDGATILPLILEPSRYTRHPTLKEYQAVNDPSKPLSMLRKSEQEEIFVALSERIEELMKEGG